MCASDVYVTLRIRRQQSLPTGRIAKPGRGGCRPAGAATPIRAHRSPHGGGPQVSNGRGKAHVMHADCADGTGQARPCRWGSPSLKPTTGQARPGRQESAASATGCGLLGPERRHRVGPAGAARRHETGQHPHHGQQQHGPGERATRRQPAPNPTLRIAGGTWRTWHSSSCRTARYPVPGLYVSDVPSRIRDRALRHRDLSRRSLRHRFRSDVDVAVHFRAIGPREHRDAHRACRSVGQAFR